MPIYSLNNTVTIRSGISDTNSNASKPILRLVKKSFSSYQDYVNAIQGRSIA